MEVSDLVEAGQSSASMGTFGKGQTRVSEFGRSTKKGRNGQIWARLRKSRLVSKASLGKVGYPWQEFPRFAHSRYGFSSLDHREMGKSGRISAKCSFCFFASGTARSLARLAE